MNSIWNKPNIVPVEKRNLDADRPWRGCTRTLMPSIIEDNPGRSQTIDGRLSSEEPVEEVGGHATMPVRDRAEGGGFQLAID